MSTNSNSSGVIPPSTRWLVLIIASIGFLFDTYELLMTPLVGVPAIAELLALPPNNPLVTDWTGRMLWISSGEKGRKRHRSRSRGDICRDAVMLV